jgi:hypothetical protein
MKSTATKETPRSEPPRPAARPRSRPAKPLGEAAAAPAAVGQTVTPHAEIVREAAYFVYERSGRVDGRDLENWLLAEAELLRQAASPAEDAGT